jgi:hypothetical protein
LELEDIQQGFVREVAMALSGYGVIHIRERLGGKLLWMPSTVVRGTGGAP